MPSQTLHPEQTAALGASKPRKLKSVLVIDDQEEIRALLREVLEDEGYDVFEAGDGFQAMTIVEGQNIDVAVTDLIMPDREGLETILALRKLKPALRIIAISGSREITYLKAARFFGASVTLSKPIEMDLFLHYVQRLCSGEASVEL
jgi:CheY-like chemotaxis protein